jgi:segregation and condensation protein B
MMTKPSEKKVLERLLGPKTQAPLSQASYETLAVIAYNQPCTRAQVEQVRGVSSDSIISRLLDRGWIEEAGNLDAPGRPALFKTSRQFLMEFGIESVKDLPPMELMSYKTIRDLEDSLRKAAGGEDKQLTIDSLLTENKENESEDSDEAEENQDGDN